jgi:hypothetical protein
MRAFDPRLRSAAKPAKVVLTVVICGLILLMNHVKDPAFAAAR